MAEPRISQSDWAALLTPGPVVVLVDPQLGENIGAVARAMANFGLSELRIVNPRDGWPNEKAIAMASGAGVMEKAQLFETTAAALADCVFVAATTARSREMLLPVLSPEATAREMKPRIARGEKCAILFGAERTGLSNEDVLRADAIVSIPTNPAFPSLNLAQAALILCYEWAKADGRSGHASDLDAAAPATQADFDNLLGHLFGELAKTNYFFPEGRGAAKERNITVMLRRAGLTAAEVRTLRGVVKALVRAGSVD